MGSFLSESPESCFELNYIFTLSPMSNYFSTSCKFSYFSVDSSTIDLNSLSDAKAFLSIFKFILFTPPKFYKSLLTDYKDSFEAGLVIFSSTFKIKKLLPTLSIT